MLVIETLEHARARGATPLAEIVGYGTSADAYHMTSGAEDGNGAYRAMKIALKQANVAPEEVQHLNAHATSTPVGDLGEINAIKHLFGTAGTVAVTSTKSATGHLLGAAGGLETIFTALALRDQIAPATLNLDNPDPAAAGLHLVAKRAGIDGHDLRLIKRLRLWRRECEYFTETLAGQINGTNQNLRQGRRLFLYLTGSRLSGHSPVFHGFSPTSQPLRPGVHR